MAPNTSLAHQLDRFDLFSDLPLIDLRSAQDFRLGHLPCATSFPAESIIARLSELPERTQALRLCGNAEQIEETIRALSNKGYQVSASLLWSEQLEMLLCSLSRLQSGDYSPRLWSPAPIVERFHNHFIESTEVGKALDIGCGAGRDSVYLATRGWQVTAIDYLPGALQKVASLAEYNQVKVTCHLLDLEKEISHFEQMPGAFDLILVVRYLQRALLPLLKQKIAPGGFLVYQTFMRGCEVFGSPKNPRFLLAAGELADLFSDFNILVDEVKYLIDGRPTNVFIAQKAGENLSGS